MTASVRWRVLSDKECDRIKSGDGWNLFKSAELPNPIDEYLDQAAPGTEEKHVYRCLQFLNNKLDFLIDQMFLNAGNRQKNQGRIIDLSGSGLKFFSKNFIDPEAFLIMNVILPETFQFQIELITRVIRVDNLDDGFHIASEIILITEEARDAIIGVVLQKQRKRIRKQKTKKVKNFG
jgi:hypothetical protein